MSSSAQAQTTVPFAHTAAGHAGISTSADGNLLIKPCTASEITFYEAARTHPNFQAHMPVYMGSLTLNDSSEEQVAATLLRDAQTKQDSKGAEPPSDTVTTDKANDTSTPGHIVSDPGIKSTPTKQWTPSGGAKLSSNLSIVLSNATAGFSKPNIIDLKLGARLWDDDAPIPKRAKLDEVANASTSSSLGFRVAGMKAYVGNVDQVSVDTVTREVNTTVGNGYKTYDKLYGRSNIVADGSNISSAFDAFLYSLTLPPRTEDSTSTTHRATARRNLIVSRLLHEVESIQFALETEESRMYSASILMVYEGDPDALDTVLTYSSSTSSSRVTAQAKAGVDPLYTTTSADEPLDTNTDADVDIQDVEESEDMDAVDIEGDDEDTPKQKIHEVVMIDFAHAKFCPGEGPDENALKGVRSVREILEGLLVD